MLPLRKLMPVVALGIALAGCQGDPANAPGPKANEKKEYTPQDAQSAQPLRNKTSDGG